MHGVTIKKISEKIQDSVKSDKDYGYFYAKANIHLLS